MSLDSWTPASQPGTVFFDRRELDLILRLYGRMVGLGEWRDYSIDTADGAVFFSVFRHTAESPLYRIEKRPALRNRQGMWAVVGQAGHVLKRGRELEPLLKLFDRKRFSVVE